MRNLPEKYFYVLLSFVIAAFLFFYFSEAGLCPLLKDDHWFQDQFLKNGFAKTYGLLYQEVNGRWFSNFMELVFLYPVLFLFPGLFLVRVLFLLLFIRGLEVFIRGFIFIRYRKTMSGNLLRLIALFCTGLFFFAFWEGRAEVWFWLSSLCVHLAGLVVLLWLFGFLLDGRRPWICALLSILIGGMSETYCLLALVLILLFVQQKVLPLKKLAIPVLLMLLSVGLNILSPGAHARLDILPPVDLLQTLKNTIHSMCLPFIVYELIPLKVVVVLFALLFGRLLRDKLGLRNKGLALPDLTKEFLLVLGLIFLSYFIPCLLLSDIVADRMQSFAYLVFLLFVFFVGLRFRSKPNS